MKTNEKKANNKAERVVKRIAEANPFSEMVLRIQVYKTIRTILNLRDEPNFQKVPPEYMKALDKFCPLE
jgi:hypothetical protein